MTAIAAARAPVRLDAIFRHGNVQTGKQAIQVDVYHTVEIAADSPNPEATLEGGLGDGKGKWQLSVDSAREIVVLSLLRSPTGHLTNLSTAPSLNPA